MRNYASPHDLDAILAIGPSGIVELAAWCLHSTSPSDWRLGPRGESPFRYLEAVFELSRDEPRVYVYSDLANISANYPRPFCYLTGGVSDSEAIAHIKTALNDVKRDYHLGSDRQEYVVCQQILKCVAIGFTPDQLRPLTEALLKLTSQRNDSLWFNVDSVEALIRVNALPEAKSLAEAARPTTYQGANSIVRCANRFIRAGYPEIAGSLLEQVSLDMELSQEQSRYLRAEIAKNRAYLGQEIARRLVEPTDIPNQLMVECLLFQNGFSPDLELIDRLFDLSFSLSLAKERATVQVEILRFWLRIEAWTQSRGMLPQLKSTLMCIPVWQKFEHCISDVATALEPYAHHHGEWIYKFICDLLLGAAQDREFWKIVHAISGCRSLIMRWAAEDVYLLQDLIRQFKKSCR